MKIGVDYIGVSSGAVIINSEGKYFLAKRGAGARDDHGTWEFPGGAINFNETREVAARRNIAEKYNFEIAIDSLLGIYDVIDTNKKDHWISTTYLCHYVKGSPGIIDTDKCTDIGWFNLNELQALILSRITSRNVADLLKII